MSGARVDSFHLVLSALRERLREGEFAPGERIPVNDIAERLRLSATPVREVLSRLVGEGVIEDRRGQGYFARSLSALDVADLYRLSYAHLSVALEPHRSAGVLEGPPAETSRRAPDPVLRVEQLFGAWVRRAGGLALAILYGRVALQLGPVRRLEPAVFADLEEEADELGRLGLAPDGEASLPAVRRFHLRRIEAAERLSHLLELRRGGGESIEAI
jgi:hypothetical protein